MKKISIIIPVLNEAEEINELIGHLHGLQGESQKEIIVVDGSEEGDTLRAIADSGVHRLASPRGRAKQMNVGADAAEGDFLLFLHADTRLPPDALHLINNVMEQQEIVGGAFDLKIDSKKLRYRVISKVASVRSRMTRIPYGDQAIFIRRSYFQHLGGYPDIPLMEDVALMRLIRKEGGEILISRQSVSTSPRRWEKEGVFYTTIRNWILLGAYYLGISPGMLVKRYRSGKDIYSKS